MFPEEIYELKKQRPFQPFRLTMEDGRKIEIQRADQIMVGKNSLIIGVMRSPNDEVYDRLEQVEADQVRRIEPVDLLC